MCDLPEEEFQEYLLWMEYASAQAMAKEKVVRIRPPIGPAALPESESEPIPA